MQYIGIMEERLPTLNQKERALLDQWTQRWPKTEPPELKLRRCGPLQRAVFSTEFRLQSLLMWKKKKPTYPEFDLDVPPLVQTLYRVGKGHRRPIIAEPGGNPSNEAFEAEKVRLRENRQEEEDKPKKRKKNRPVPSEAPLGQRPIFSFLNKVPAARSPPVDPVPPSPPSRACQLVCVAESFAASSSTSAATSSTAASSSSAATSSTAASSSSSAASSSSSSSNTAGSSIPSLLTPATPPPDTPNGVRNGGRKRKAPKPAAAPAPDAEPDPENPLAGMSQEEFHKQLDDQILTYLLRVYEGIAHVLHPEREDVQWWINRCGREGNVLRKQVARMGVDAVTAEEWYMKYGHEGHISREEMFRWFFWMKNSPSYDTGAFCSRSDCSDADFKASVKKVTQYLNQVVNEIFWTDRLSPWNHTPHFPFFTTHFADSMPICALGGSLSDILFNPKYAGHVYKITVAIDALGNIVWICNLNPGTTPDVIIWDKEGPQRSRGQFFDFELGNHDGAYKGRNFSAVPYIGRKKLTELQKMYNDVHGFYRARVEHLFARLWSWKIVRNTWTGSSAELHATTRVLLHLTQFITRRQTRYQPYGPWPHVPESVWEDEQATAEGEENDDGVCCQLCGHRPAGIEECQTCQLNMCPSCDGVHACYTPEPEAV